MPRQRTTYKTKRKHHLGNQYSRNKPNPMCDDAEEVRNCSTRPTTPVNLENQFQPNNLRSSSSKKLCFENYEQFDSYGNGNGIFDLTLLSHAIQQFVKCKFCESTECVVLSILSDNNENGLVQNYQLSCTVCSKCEIFKNSNLSPGGKLYETNTKFVYAMRSIGKGLTAAKEFCALMDLPKPPQKFTKYHNELGIALKSCAQSSMLRATNEAVQINNECSDIPVALDGSWQRRGFKSLNGLVSVSSFDTGKILDVAVLSKFCQICTTSKNDPVEHICSKNYEGSSGGMEIAGAVQVFKNSVTRNVRYTKYLGDGDSKAFETVQKEKPYGDQVTIEKLECIGHIQKRMGTRLRELKKKTRGQKLPDGKVLGGKSRLTDVQVDKLQTYYGLAIRRGCTSVQEMKKNIWATYFHKLSTNAKPQHGLCPKGADTWCGYHKAVAEGGTYNHKDSIPYDVMLKIKPIYQALTNDELLKKCLHGHTQNPNESFNHVVWSKVPKQVFVRLKTLEIGVYDAVLTFNEGKSSRLAVYKELGLSLSKKSVDVLRALDITRLKKAEKDALAMTKEARIERRKRRLMQDEQDEDPDNPQYGAGLF